MTTGTAGRRRGRARRGPFTVLAMLVIVVPALGGCRSSDDDDDSAANTTTTSGSKSDLPMTYAQAKADGKEGDIEWGDQCDTERGRLKVPVVNGPPCVEPWD